VPLLSQYSAMTIQGSGISNAGTSSASSYNVTSSYTTIYHSSTTYKVGVTFVSGGETATYTIWVQNDGTVVAVAITAGGYSINETGSQAQGLVTGAFAEFTLQVQLESQINYYTNNSFFHSTGTSTVQIGGTSVSVTNYAANNLPETVNECGDITTLTAYSFSIGTPHGATLPLVVSVHIAGSDVINGQTENFDYSALVTSITVA